MDESKFQLWLLLPLICLLFQCSNDNQKTNQEGLPEVVITDNDILPFDQLVEEIHFIPLRQPSDTLVNMGCRVYELFISDKIYYASRCFNDLSIHSFDMAGNYLQGWNKKGEGPEAYPSLHGIGVSDNILVLNAGNGSIYKYMLPEFKFEEKVDLGDFEFIATLALTPLNHWLVADGNPSISNENGTYPVFHLVNPETKEKMPLPIFASALTDEIDEGNITSMDNDFLLNFALSDTLFVLKDTEVAPWFKLDFGKRKLSSKDMELEVEPFMEKAIISQSVAFNSGKVLFADDVVKLKIYGLKTNPEFSIDDMATFPFFDAFIDMNDYQVKSMPSLTGIRNKGFAHDGYFYEFLHSEDWQRAEQEGHFGKYQADLSNAIKNLSDKEDPIIIKYKVAFKGVFY